MVRLSSSESARFNAKFMSTPSTKTDPLTEFRRKGGVMRWAGTSKAKRAAAMRNLAQLRWGKARAAVSRAKEPRP